MGTLNIIDWCAKNDNPPPAWSEQAGSVYVTFLPAIFPSAQRSTEKVIPEITRQVEDEAHDEAHEPMSDIESAQRGLNLGVSFFIYNFLFSAEKSTQLFLPMKDFGNNVARRNFSSFVTAFALSMRPSMTFCTCANSTNKWTKRF